MSINYIQFMCNLDKTNINIWLMVIEPLSRSAIIAL